MSYATRKIAQTLLILAVIPLSVAIASDLTIDCYSTSSGMMFSTGGDFELSGTVGQPDAGTLAGGDFELGGGFWPSVEEFCFADLNDDHMVGLADLAILLANYNTLSGATYLDGDLDTDRDVDLSDLAALLAVYGDICD